jgi:cell division protein FtsB
VLGGIAWILFLTALLTGVVAINVAVLRQNMQLENLTGERADLRAHNAELRSQLSKAVSPSLVERLARTRLGLVQVAPGETTYVQLGAGGK